ncbi:hypothetical protein [Myroides marinus]|uniref:hypothetical protein n=1 Tax=Myroides marinus TaxID=703342 RepID=UPI002575E098|nr:hypothetical protein [Myroides marinus]MDM1531346.1 hypothetical protein [Myroides marinus]MDM1538506.1 hypothetical protein [Myroides marinus]
MKKYIFYICSIATFLLTSTVVLAQFPYQSTLTKGDEFYQFSSSVTFDSNGATLTPANNNITRGFYLNDLAFTVDRGFIIGFDYLMTGGGAGTNFADGLALVLFDGSETAPRMGSDGSGLGYAYKTPVSSEQGLTKGFLAVGVDLWGNFKVRRADGVKEYRNGIRNGTNNSTLLDDGGKTADANNHITIRGQGSGGEGYPVLITQSTTNFNSRTMLNFSNGLYDIKPVDPQNTPFSFKLRENPNSDESDLTALVGDKSYRRVEISMLPGNKSGVVGFYMAVDVIHGTQKSRVINNYFLPKEARINYMEVSGSPESSNVLKPLDLKAPQTFKIGFVASTGGFNQRHIVRNLSLYIPFSPSVGGIYLTDLCKDTPTEIDVLEKSVGFDSNIYSGEGDLSALGKREFLDPYSFQFRMIVNNVYEDTAQPYIAVSQYGTYEYNPVTTKVVFTPNKGVTMPTSDQVYFTIRNKDKQLANGTNLGSEQFRSNTATLRLVFGKNCNEVLMVNGNSI